jgi:hypothetical protein
VRAVLELWHAEATKALIYGTHGSFNTMHFSLFRLHFEKKVQLVKIKR